MAEELSEAAKQELAAGKEARERSFKEFTEKTQGKPTPTQDENDRAKLGEHITEHEPDGSPEDPGGGSPLQRERGGQTRAMQSSGTQSQSYRTRQSQAQSEMPSSPRAVYPAGTRKSDTTQTQMS